MGISSQKQLLPSVSQPIAYIPQLDALRAFAAIGVVIAHQGVFHNIFGLDRISHRLGGFGVDMFFVLSGYLITGILLHCKNHCAGQSLSLTLRQFYFRRALRIFPLYYGVFIVFALLEVEGIRQNWIWFMTYTVNFGKAFSHYPGFYPLTHFWTLAVEEQFYLLWPLIVLLLSPRKLIYACCLLTIASLLYRCVAIYNEIPPPIVQQFTFGCFDPLCIGAAFATISYHNWKPSIFYQTCLWIGTPLSATVLIFGNETVLFSVGRLVYSMMFGAIIYHLAKGGNRRLNSLLGHKPILFMGKISYGIYVYHMPVIWILGSYPIHVSSGLIGRPLNFIFILMTTIAIATVSWFVFENPINVLKRFFPYRVRSVS